jgi:hypothetical protein
MGWKAGSLGAGARGSEEYERIAGNSSLIIYEKTEWVIDFYNERGNMKLFNSSKSVIRKSV